MNNARNARSNNGWGICRSPPPRRAAISNQTLSFPPCRKGREALKPAQRANVSRGHASGGGVWGRRQSVRDDVITMIVRYDIKSVRRTCDSVRSSLSVLAGLATILSEAAETISFLRLEEEPSVRRFLRLRASMRSEDGWMKHPTHVNCFGHRHVLEPKMLTGSGQKARSWLLQRTSGANGHKQLPV